MRAISLQGLIALHQCSIPLFQLYHLLLVVPAKLFLLVELFKNMNNMLSVRYEFSSLSDWKICDRSWNTWDCLTSSQSCQSCQEFTTIQCRIRTMITTVRAISVVYRGMFVLHSLLIYFSWWLMWLWFVHPEKKQDWWHLLRASFKIRISVQENFLRSAEKRKSVFNHTRCVVCSFDLRSPSHHWSSWSRSHSMARQWEAEQQERTFFYFEKMHSSLRMNPQLSRFEEARGAKTRTQQQPTTLITHKSNNNHRHHQNNKKSFFIIDSPIALPQAYQHHHAQLTTDSLLIKRTIDISHGTRKYNRRNQAAFTYEHTYHTTTKAWSSTITITIIITATMTTT